MSELNDKQRRFVQEYLVDSNATQAAIRAGYSRKTAEQQGPRLLGNVGVARLIREGQAELSRSTGINARTVLEELLRIAQSDVRGLFNEDGTLKHPKDMPEDVRRTIAGIDVVDVPGTALSFTKKVRMWDKLRALEMLAKHLGLLKERVELTGKDGGPVEVAELTADQARKLILERLGQAGV